MDYKDLPLKQRKIKFKANTTKPVESFAKTLYVWTAICGFVLFMFGYRYFYHAGVIDETRITSVHNCIIKEPVRKDHTSGKNRQYYYVFKFRGSDLEFRFFKSYYEYSEGPYPISKLQEGDTVSIQVESKDLEDLRNKYGGQLEIVNLGLHNRFLINHKYRNIDIENTNKNCFYVCLTIFVVLVATIFLNMSIKDPYRY